MRALASVVTLLLISACDKGGDPAASTGTADSAKPDAAKPDAAKPDAAKPEVAKAEPKSKVKKKKPEPMSAKQAAELRKQFRTKLDEGRKQTKAGKHEEGIKLYHEALAIEPSNPTALAELGWAALQANQLDLAQGATAQALIFSRKPEQQGMILYNLGRVAEARSKNDDAIAHYRDSLARRPNDTVQKRLDGLLAATANVPEPGRGLGRVASGIAELEAACKQLVELECANIYTIEEDGCTCQVSMQDDSGWAMLELGESNAVENMLWFPAIKTSSGWTVFDSIAWIYNPGAFGIWEEAQWETPTFQDLLPGGEQEWVLQFSKDRSDSDMGINEFESESYATTVVCSRGGAEAWCTTPMLREFSYSRDVEFEDEQPIEGEEPIDHTGLPIERKFSCKLELGAKVVVSDVVGGDQVDEWMDGADALPAGEHDLATLMGKPPAAEKPATPEAPAAPK
jgi:tetratricopeptide (TPR) repeat protein